MTIPIFYDMIEKTLSVVISVIAAVALIITTGNPLSGEKNVLTVTTHKISALHKYDNIVLKDS